MRKVKVVCTIGPSSNTKSTVSSLIKNGMGVARLNFSHGDHESHRKAIRLIREGAEKHGKTVALLQDLQGLKIRSGLIRGGSVLLKKGSEVLVLPGKGVGDEKKIYVSYSNLVRDAREGDKIFLDDGLIKPEIISRGKTSLKARVVEGGVMKDRKGINFPFRISSRPFTRKDAENLEFGLRMGIDYIALSFVRTADDIRAVKNWLSKKKDGTSIIAKIERREAVDNIEEILDEVDGIMIARGDLGVEVSPEEVPVKQKRLIELANKKGKIVITATQMLESMTEHKCPTRAEAADVANAVIDGSDALMLSGETASGKYPVETLKMMNRIIEFTEAQYSMPVSPFTIQRPCPSKIKGMLETYSYLDAPFSAAVANAACSAAEDIQAKFIIAFTRSGFTARLVSKFRPKTPIIAFALSEQVQRRMCIYWGVLPRLMRPLTGTDEMIIEVERSLISEGLAREGDRVVITASTPIAGTGKTNLLKLHSVGANALHHR